MALQPGTPIPGSSDPRTVEQNNTLQSIQCVHRDSSLGGQYAGMVLYPDGTLTADRSQVKYVSEWQPAYYKSVFEARGKPTGLDAPNDRNGGYIVSLGVDGVPNQTIGCSAQYEQTVAERAELMAYAKSGGGSPAAGMAGGMSQQEADDLARQGMPVASPATNPIAHQPAPVPSIPITPPAPAPPAPATAPGASLGNSGPAANGGGGGGVAPQPAAAANLAAGVTAAANVGAEVKGAAAPATIASRAAAIPWWGWLLLLIGLTSSSEKSGE